MFEKFLSSGEVEIYHTTSRSTSIDIVRNEIEISEEEDAMGYGVRVIEKGKQGFSYTTSLEKIGECLEKARAISKLGASNAGLPEESRYSEPRGLYDKRIASLSPADCVKYAQELVETANSHGVTVTEGNFDVSVARVVIENSNGVSVEDAGTSVYASASVLAGKDSTATEYEFSRSMVDVHSIGDRASSLALASLNPRTISGGEYSIIMDPLAVSDLFSHALVPAFNGDRVQRGKSKLGDLAGEAVASEIVSITDDGTLEHCLNSGKADDEGVPTQRTPLIENGVLKGFLYDYYTASKANKESTGNATRSFQTLPVIGPTNFIVKEGRSTRDDIIHETSKGLLVSSIVGAHTSNPTSGDFAVELENTFLVENGEVTHPVKQGILTGNIFQLLKQIDLVANNTRQVSAIMTPSIRVKEMGVVT